MKGSPIIIKILVLTSLCGLAGCGQPEQPEVSVDADALSNFRPNDGDSTAHPAPPEYKYTPTPPPPVRGTTVAKSEAPPKLFEGMLEKELKRRAPELLGSLFDNPEDAEAVGELIVQAPGIWNKIVERSNAEGKSPAELIGSEVVVSIIEEKTSGISIPPEMGENLPEAIENVKKSADDGSLLEMLGTLILREVLEEK